MKDIRNSNFKNYIKEHPVTVLSTVCLWFEIICSFIFIERTSFVSSGIMLITIIIHSKLHEIEADDNDLF